MTIYDKILHLLNKLPHQIQVSFALYCCNDIKELIIDERSIKALIIVEKWLNNPASVSSQELQDAYAASASASAATAAATAAASAYAAYAAAATAASAAYAATAYASAATAYASAATATAYAAYAAAYAAYAAAYSAKKDKKLLQYYNHLITMIQNLTDLQKLIFNIPQDLLQGSDK